jgi:hypothetical protein
VDDAMTASKAPDEKLLTRRQLAEFLTASGFPISHSTLSKYCSPAINIGPPADCWWGKLPMYRPSRALEWARCRLRLTKAPAAEVARAAATAVAKRNASKQRDRSESEAWHRPSMAAQVARPAGRRPKSSLFSKQRAVGSGA